MLLRHGRVAAEGWWAPYSEHIPHMLFSLSKSFTSTAVGFAVSEGLLKVGDPVVSFFPDKLPSPVSANLQAMQVRHLLSMSTGHDEDASDRTAAQEDGDWVRAFLAQQVEHAPGSKFVYNSAATYMCSAIVQSLTGETLLEYLTPRLFEPLGIESPTWESCPKGINVGGWGLSLKTEDIARFGLCYLQNGIWNGRQLIPAAWVGEATSKQVSNGDGGESDWAQGYGYQFWRCRHSAFRGDGAFGQFCVVMPEQDAVLAVTGGMQELQPALDAVWDHLLPGMQPVSDAPANADLPRRLGGLAVPVPAGSSQSPTGARVSGRTFRLEPNEQKLETATFSFTPQSGSVVLRGKDGEQVITCGFTEWTGGMAPGSGGLPRHGTPPDRRTASRGAWTAEATYTMCTCYIETPFVETTTCRFSGDDVTIARQYNVGFGPTEQPPIAGHAV